MHCMTSFVLFGFVCAGSEQAVQYVMIGAVSDKEW